MKKLGLWAISALLVLMVPTAFAVKVNTLYQATVPVNSQSAEEREQAVQKALDQVLVKVAGNHQVLTDPKITAAKAPAETLMQEFSYSSRPGTDGTAYVLHVQFDPDGINQVLRDAGAPIWGQNRPLMVAWIELEAPDRPTEIISSDSTAPLALHLKQFADDRGLPFIFPMMDMTDLSLISNDDITQMVNTTVLKATERYAAPIVVIGHVIQNEKGFSSEWRLLLDNGLSDWALPTQSLDEMLATTINHIGDAVASHYSVITTNQIQQNIILKISAINQQTEFTQLVRYLEHLTPVAEVAILRIANNEILLNISVRSTQQAFMQAIALGRKLIPVPDSDPSELAYQWNP